MNQSLANRLRIGFAITFAVFAVVTIFGVGRLFQIRSNYEHDVARSYERELSVGQLQQAFQHERDAADLDAVMPTGAALHLHRAIATSRVIANTARSALEVDPESEAAFALRIKAQARWLALVTRGLANNRAPPLAREKVLADAVLKADREFAQREQNRRAELRSDVDGDTGVTALLVGIGFISGLVAAILLVSSIVSAVRRPLDQLVDAAGRLASGDLKARVAIDGPRETAALGAAFNEMADELQLAYRHVEEGHEQLAVTVRSLSDGVITVDEAGIVNDANPAARRLLPTVVAEVDIRHAISDLGSPEEIDRILADEGAGEISLEHGGRTLVIRASSLGEGAGSVLSVRDISERNRVERMKDEFVLTASHELRSPLTSVQGFAELLLMESSTLTPRQAETVEIILENSRHLVRLLNDLLDLARSDAGRLEVKPIPAEVEPLIMDPVRAMWAQADSKGQTIEVEIAEDLPLVEVEPDRIRQVLVNLITNAADYSPMGSKIRISARQVAERIEILVTDNGAGIPPEQIEHIFDRFTRGDAGITQRIDGTGLGLAISKSLIELHGGSLVAESAPGGGATFRISLPFLTEIRSATSSPAAPLADGRPTDA